MGGNVNNNSNKINNALMINKTINKLIRLFLQILFLLTVYLQIIEDNSNY